MAAAAEQWIPLGVSESGLRVFVERGSIERVGPRVVATVRSGSRAPIAGRIVVVYQTEQFDCAARRWRLTGFEGRDATDQLVDRKMLDGPMLPVVDGTIGARTLDTVCLVAKDLPPGSPRLR